MFFHLGRVGTARRTPPAAAALFALLGFEHRASKVGLPHSFSAPAALWFAWAFAMAMPLGPSDGQNHSTECKTLAENNGSRRRGVLVRTQPMTALLGDGYHDHRPPFNSRVLGC